LRGICTYYILFHQYTAYIYEAVKILHSISSVKERNLFFKLVDVDNHINFFTTHSQPADATQLKC